MFFLTAPFIEHCRNISAPIIIRCIGSISGRPICGFFRSKKSRPLPYVPLSYPFVERLIGTIPREYFDQTLF